MATKSELESKPLSDLHALAADAGVEKFRMLTRAELVERLSGGVGEGAGSGASARGSDSRSRGARSGSEGARSGDGRERSGRERSGESPQGSGEGRERRRRRRRGDGDEGSPDGDDLGRRAYGSPSESPADDPTPDPSAPGARESAPRIPESSVGGSDREAAAPAASEPSRPRRRRRRRRFGRRKSGVTIQDLLLPPEAGRQAILCAETREGCTRLLRGIASDLAEDSKGPDPVVLLIDPGPDELADWKREAPQAEIVAAGQARHATDALEQAAKRAGTGDDVILLVDSLTRLASDFADSDTAKEFFDAGRVQGGSGGGSLTVVAALERS